jgi:uncharacterized membrane protein
MTWFALAVASGLQIGITLIFVGALVDTSNLAAHGFAAAVWVLATAVVWGVATDRFGPEDI